MNISLRRHWAPLLFCTFAVIGTTEGQTMSYETLKSIGRSEYFTGHFDKAEAFLRSALEVAERGGNDYDVATTQGDLGNVYQKEDRLEEAEQAYAKALFIFRRISDTHYAVTVMLLNLGVTYSLEGRYPDALKVLNEALKLNAKNTPDQRGLGVQILNSLALVYLRRGKINKAETLLDQANAIRSREEVDSDLTDAQILNNRAAIYQRQHKYAKAEEAYKRSLQITELRLGPFHPDLPLTLANLGALYADLRRYREAEDQYRRGLGILEEMRPVPHGRIAGTLQALSKLYLKKGEKTTAESILAQAVEITRRNPAPDPRTPMLLDAYADVLDSLGKRQEARRLHAEARRTRAAMALMVRVPKPN